MRIKLRDLHRVNEHFFIGGVHSSGGTVNKNYREAHRRVSASKIYGTNLLSSMFFLDSHPQIKTF